MESVSVSELDLISVNEPQINSLIDSCEFDNYPVHESVGVPLASRADRVGHPRALVELHEHVSIVQRDVEIHTLWEH